jgi:hypothetical protein
MDSLADKNVLPIRYVVKERVSNLFCLDGIVIN